MQQVDADRFALSYAKWSRRIFERSLSRFTWLPTEKNEYGTYIQNIYELCGLKAPHQNRIFFAESPIEAYFTALFLNKLFACPEQDSRIYLHHDEPYRFGEHNRYLNHRDNKSFAKLIRFAEELLEDETPNLALRAVPAKIYQELKNCMGASVNFPLADSFLYQEDFLSPLQNDSLEWVNNAFKQMLDSPRHDQASRCEMNDETAHFSYELPAWHLFPSMENIEYAVNHSPLSSVNELREMQIAYPSLLDFHYFWNYSNAKRSRLFRLWSTLKLKTSVQLFHKDYCIVASMPSKIQIDPYGRLHSARGPALTWRDGLSFYAYEGVSVPRYVIETPEKITPEIIKSETNQEVHQIMRKLYGFDRYFKELKTKTVNRDDWGELLTFRLDGEWHFAVKVLNSTPEPDGTYKDYILRVRDPKIHYPNHPRTARGAIASTFRNPQTGELIFESPEDYQPLVMT